MLLSAERATTIANGALGQLLAGPVLTPAAAAAWHDKVVMESTRSLFDDWGTIEEADLRLAGYWVLMALLDQHLRQGEMGINFQRQHDQLPDLSAFKGHGAAESADPAPGSEA